MGRKRQGDGDRKDGRPLPAAVDMAEVIDEAMRLLRAALEEGRPDGVAREALRIYWGADDPSHKTEATHAAFLSHWPSFLAYLEDSGAQDRPLAKEEIAALLIHRTRLRQRRREYRDEQMAQQVDRAHARGSDGERLPFDPAAPRARGEALKSLREEIDSVVMNYPVRDRMIIELRYFAELPPKQIVEAVRKALPDEPISLATVSRVLAKFEDDLRRRLRED
jgi:hypothetical protein